MHWRCSLRLAAVELGNGMLGMAEKSLARTLALAKPPYPYHIVRDLASPF